MTVYFVEVRPAVKRSGPPRLVPLAEVSQYTGFRSVFCYDTATAELIRKQGGTAGLRDMYVYADTMFVDFDNSTGEELLAYLKQEAIAHDVYDSGGRSVHVHIPLEPVFGSWVPKACKDWQRKFAPGSDTSFLHAAGVYRLPGTFHAKNPGRCKVLVARYEGKKLQLERPKIQAPVSFAGADSEGSIEEFFCLLLQNRNEGNRAPHLFKLAITGAEAGLPFEETLDSMRWWNNRFANPPRDDLTVQKQCESAYRRLSRKQA